MFLFRITSLLKKKNLKKWNWWGHHQPHPGIMSSPTPIKPLAHYLCATLVYTAKDLKAETEIKWGSLGPLGLAELMGTLVKKKKTATYSLSPPPLSLQAKSLLPLILPVSLEGYPFQQQEWVLTHTPNTADFASSAAGADRYSQRNLSASIHFLLPYLVPLLPKTPAFLE